MKGKSKGGGKEKAACGRKRGDNLSGLPADAWDQPLGQGARTIRIQVLIRLEIRINAIGSKRGCAHLYTIETYLCKSVFLPAAGEAQDLSILLKMIRNAASFLWCPRRHP